MLENEVIDNNLNIVILCGGRGERMHPITNDIPKPLLKIKGKPILSYIIEHLSQYNFHNLIFATGYKSNEICNYINEHYEKSIYKIVNSGDVDIVKRIQDSCKYIKKDFMVLYGDTISNINLYDLIRYHQSQQEPATMTLWPLRSQFGIVDVSDDGKVLGFQEKPVLDKWINIGYFYFKNEMKEKINKFDKFEVFLKDLVDQKILNAYKHSGLHITINTLKELAEAEKSIVEIGGKRK